MSDLQKRSFDKMGMEWNGYRWVFDGGSGLRTTIVPGDDPDALAFMATDN